MIYLVREVCKTNITNFCMHMVQRLSMAATVSPHLYMTLGGVAGKCCLLRIIIMSVNLVYLTIMELLQIL